MSVFKVTVEQSSPSLTFIFTMESNCELVEEFTSVEDITFWDVLRYIRKKAYEMVYSLDLIDPKITIEEISDG